MLNRHRAPELLEVHADLHQATDVATRHKVGARSDDRLGLRSTEIRRQPGLIEVVGAGRATTALPILETDEIQPLDLSQQTTRLLDNSLSLLEMAGTLIRQTQWLGQRRNVDQT